MIPTAAARILIIEDNPVDQEAIRRAFRKQRLANPLVFAADGVEGLEILRGTADVPPLSRPYIILLDLNMPRMSGIEFLQIVRQDPQLRDAVVFVLTTSKHEEDLVSSYQLNVAGYIVKSTAGKDFIRLTDLLDSYWKIVELLTE